MSWNFITPLVTPAVAILALLTLVVSVYTAKVVRRAEQRVILYQAVLRAADIKPPEPPPTHQRPMGGHLRRVATIGALTGAASWVARLVRSHPYVAGGVVLAAATVTGVVLLPAPSRSGPPVLLPMPATSAPASAVRTGAGESISSPAPTTTPPSSPDRSIVRITETAELSLPGVPTGIIPTVPTIPILTTPTATVPTMTTPPTAAAVGRGLCIVLTLREELSICLPGIRTPAPLRG